MPTDNRPAVSWLLAGFAPDGKPVALANPVAFEAARTAVHGPAPTEPPPPDPEPVVKPLLRTLELWDAKRDVKLRDLTTSTTQIDLKDNPEIAFIALPANERVKSVKFELNGSVSRTESSQPFASHGDEGAGKPLSWKPAVGQYTVKATPFAEVEAKGEAGDPFVLLLVVVDTTVDIVIPPAAADLVVQPGDDLSEAYAKAKSGTEAKPFVLGLHPNGAWKEPLYLNKSYVTIKGLPDKGGKRPSISGDTAFSAASNLRGLTLQGIDCFGNGKGQGLRFIVKKIVGLNLLDMTFKGFTGPITIQCDASLPVADWVTDVLIDGCRLYDGVGQTDREGHNFMVGINGLTIRRTHMDKGGWFKKASDGSQRFRIYGHAQYSQAGILRALYEDLVVSRAESFGIQHRGPLLKVGDANVTNDRGPTFRRIAFVDCGIAYLANGPEANAEDIFVQAGHYHGPEWLHGQGAYQFHVGKGTSKNITRFVGPDPAEDKRSTEKELRKRMQSRMKAFDLSKRNPEEGAAWWWNKDVSLTRINERDFSGEGGLPKVNRLGDCLEVVEALRGGLGIMDGLQELFEIRDKWAK